MKKIINFHTAKFVILGAGDTGRSINSYLQTKQARILRVLDTRDHPPQLPGISVIGGPLQSQNVMDADIIVVSPGISIFEPILQQAIVSGKEVIGDIELFARAIYSLPIKVIGVTGSNGKTTVTSLTAFLAKNSGINTLVAGNIGTPVLDALIEFEASGNYPELAVLELSSFQLETTYSLTLASSTVLNISEDHLDRYRNLLEYAYIKANIFKHSLVQVLNQDDILVSAMAQSNCEHLFFADKNASYQLVDTEKGLALQINSEVYVYVQELQLVGRHNYLNCLASLALLAGAGYSLDLFKNGLVKFAGLEHRMQKVTEHAGILYIEDSKGTNVGAVIAGVRGIDRPVQLILGGDGKGQDFTPLRELVLAKCKSVALIGQDAKNIAKILDKIENVNLYHTLEDATSACIAKAQAGDAVILSPACASWDMFTNYKHRAQVFVDTVYAITQKNN